MAKVIEDMLVIKVSRIVRDGEPGNKVLEDDLKDAIASTLPTLLDEIINDRSVIVELAELE